jgi:Xaa-Pro aminopeptidase
MATNTVAPAAPPTTTTDPKLVKLRQLLASAESGTGVDALIVPSEDPHMSEYPPECDARRSFISNFDGSAGTVVITAAAAALWTDGRYFLQAETQLGPDWTLMKAGTAKVPEIHEWLISNLPENARVGIDPTCHTIEAAEKLAKQLAATGRSLVPLTSNPVDAVWGSARPAPPKAPLRIHALEWAGQTVAEKLEAARKEMTTAGAGALAVTMLDEVAWLMNLRGGDVAYNPVFLSYALVTIDSAILFVDSDKISPEVASHLADAGVVVKPYEEAFNDVKNLASQGVKIWMDPSKASFAMKTVAIESAAANRKREENGNAKINSNNIVLEKPSVVTAAKAVKNEAELKGFHEAHARDGVALVKFFNWLEKTIESGVTLTECEIDTELTARRAAQAGFIELSFPTIAGANSNGAIIHYRPLPESCSIVDKTTLLLLDSGGQYDCGTTDITRTMHMGTPTEHQCTAFTAVLKGHICLDVAIWPEGTPGCALDTLARASLWKLGLNYRHGTGHGVGAALNVHEGPQSISTRFWNTTPLLPNMVCSNEPGYYEDGAFGVRIENLFVIVPAETKHKFAGEYYTCDRLTVCPLQKKMIVKKDLTQDEISWVDQYHEHVYNVLAPRLEAEGGCAEELEWLKNATSPL